jgi:S1-C subfamily serine protease
MTKIFKSCWKTALLTFFIAGSVVLFAELAKADLEGEGLIAKPVPQKTEALGAVKICIDPQCQRGHGTAFSLYDGYFLTAGHVTQSSKTFYLKTSKGFVQTAKTIWTSTQSDWGLLHTKGLKYMDLPKTKLNCEAPKQGENISNISNPAEMEFVVVKGYIASKAQKKLGQWKEVFPMVLPGFFGSSGSPVFNEKNEVIGNFVGALNTGAIAIMEPLYKICDILPPKKTLWTFERVNNGNE